MLNKQSPAENFDSKQNWIFLAFALLIAVVPRGVRILYPYVWFEDAAYLYHAFALLSGQQPFVDGIYAHPPALEGLLALLYAVFGVSYRVAELLSAAVMAATTLLVYSICKKQTRPWAALCGTAAFSLSPLLARYHVFEREVFTLALASLAFYMVPAGKENSVSAFLTGALAGLAMAIKISGFFLLLPLLTVYLLRRKRRETFGCIFGWLAVGCGVWAYLLLSFGRPAFLQLLVLHFTKGGTASFWSNLDNTIIPNLNYLLVLGTGGLILGVIRERNSIVLAAAIYAAEIFVFFSILSETLWAHNMIDMLLPLSLGTALAVGQIFSPATMDKDKIKKVAIIAVPAVVFILVGALHPRHLKAGWGYVPREELGRAAKFVRQKVPASRLIIAPHYLAAEAGRRKLVDYRELAGPYLWLLHRIKQEGYAGLRRHRQFGSWKQMVRRTASLWQTDEIEAIRARRVGAVIWDEVFPEWAYYQKLAGAVEAKSGLYSKAGYQVRYRGGPYVIWLPE